MLSQTDPEMLKAVRDMLYKVAEEFRKIDDEEVTDLA
jgi:hypothetical protein